MTYEVVEGVKIPALSSIRGKIKQYLYDCRFLISGNVLEIGTYTESKEHWWLDNRDLANENVESWIGIDVVDGINVDAVMDAKAMTFEDNTFDTVICSEVLEHEFYPAEILKECLRVLKPNGSLICTTVFCMHYHGIKRSDSTMIYEDYWRFTGACLKRLMEEAGFTDVEIFEDGYIPFVLSDHGERETQLRAACHTFARGKKADVVD